MGPKPTPGEEGKWFAAAKSAGLFPEAIALAIRDPCSQQTLTRAARDFAEKNPPFALEAGMAALHWLVEGYGYEVTSVHVHDAHAHAMIAARNAGPAEETKQRIRELVSKETFGDRFVTKILGRELELGPRRATARLGLTRSARGARNRKREKKLPRTLSEEEFDRLEEEVRERVRRE